MSLHLILLAAGRSVRFGGNKLLHPVEGIPVYRRALNLLLALRGAHPDWEITVVTAYPEVVEACGRLDVDWVVNEDNGRGISSSIQLGLARVDGERACAFFVADQPWLTDETAERFLQGFLSSGKGLGCLCWGDAWGNPCAFSPRYFGQLAALEGDRGGKSILRGHPEDVYCCQAGASRELVDVDVRDCLPPLS